MGWTTTHKDNEKSVKSFFSGEFDCIKSNGAKITVIDCASSLHEAYLAVEHLAPGKPREVFGIVCLIHYMPKDHFNFGYKDMEESAEPFYYNCPERILNLLTPTTSENATEWRLKCRETIEKKKKKPRFKVGDILQFEEAIAFANGFESRRFKCVCKRPLSFKQPDVDRQRFWIRRETLNRVPYVVNPASLHSLS